MTKEGIKSNFKKLSKKLKFRISPHDFRRGGPTFAAEMGVSARPGILQGGWRDFNTYAQYTRATELRAVRPYLLSSVIAGKERATADTMAPSSGAPDAAYGSPEGWLTGLEPATP